MMKPDEEQRNRHRTRLVPGKPGRAEPRGPDEPAAKPKTPPDEADYATADMNPRPRGGGYETR